MRTSLLFLLFTLIIPEINNAQTVGLISNSGQSEEGYILFAPIMSNQTYLIDKCGRKVHEWSSAYKPGQSCYLLENGQLLRTGNSNNAIYTAGGTGGIIELLDWNDNVIWSYTISNSAECQHHDVCPLPNGNILVICWEAHSDQEAIDHGRNPSLTTSSIWSEKIIEIQPISTSSANIVWEWHAWDHLVQEFDSAKLSFGVVADHPELINLNYNANASNSDWLHLNSIDYNEELDQILLSSHNFNEVWIIDHSTTSLESSSHFGGNSGHGGDLLYRWGNPFAYNRGIMGSKKFFGQHNAQWIDAGLSGQGSILVFNNGLNRPQGDYSSVESFTPPIAEDQYQIASSGPILPIASDWIYTTSTPTDFYANNISGAQRLENGNTLICVGPEGRFFEIDQNEAVSWEYINPVGNAGPVNQGSSVTGNLVFRSTSYPSTYPGFNGQNLIPGDPIELNPSATDCEVNSIIEKVENQVVVFPNPFLDQFTLQNANDIIALSLQDVFAKKVTLTIGKLHQDQIVGLETNVPSGVYFLEITYSNRAEVVRLIKR